MAGKVGDARDFFAAHCQLPRWQVAHYVSLIEAPDGTLAAISTCCDGVDDAERMLKSALAALSGQVPVSAQSDAVIVSRDDLRAILGEPPFHAGARARLREALGEASDDPSH